MENNYPKFNADEDALLNRAANELFKGGAMEQIHLSYPTASGNIDESPSGVLTNDEVYDFMQENRDRTFDHTTPEGRNLFRQFEEANHRRNKFSFSHFGKMVETIAHVPVDIVKGVFSNNPVKTSVSVADGIARDARDLYVLLAQSEDPSSPLFRFKDFITGGGTVEDRIKQFNEARWWGNKSNALEEGKDTVLEDWVPDDYRQFARSLIDPKFANAVSYIGLDTPQFIKSAFKRNGLKSSINAFKDVAEEATGTILAQDAKQAEDWFSVNAAKFRKLSQKLTGETMVGTAEVVSKPFDFIKDRIARGSTAIESRLGYVPNELANGSSTLLSDVTEVAARGTELGPVRSVLFSLGVKPIAEYASVFGNELIDAAQGVVKINPAYSGMDLMERLALNGGRISMSKEAQVVAKFTNVVVGWPASMAFPTLKRAIGDAAYMGVLGYANARGEGASSGMGVGFAWGGFSGGLRHIHNVYNHSIAHSRIIENFDNAQIVEISKTNPRHAEEVREFLKFVDSKGSARVSATVRAQFMMGWVTSPDSEVRFKSAEEMIKEYGQQEFMHQVGGTFEEARSVKGGDLTFGGRNIIWLNKEAASPETGVHEYSHRFLDTLFSRNDNTAHESVRNFIGKAVDGGVVPDAVLAEFIGQYSKARFGLDDAWLYGPSDKTQDGGYGNIAYVKEQLAEVRKELAADPQNPFTPEERDNGYGKVTKFRLFHDHPVLERMIHEVFAYNQSNSLLRKSPDIFLRDPKFKSIRYTMENWFTLMNQRKVNDLEAAGVLIKKKVKGDTTLLESVFWDDGKFQSFELLDQWTDKTMRDVLRYGDVNVMTLQGEKAEAYMKQNGKQRFLKGGKVKSKKEIEFQITEDADKIANALDTLSDAIKPKWDVTANGTKKIDLTNLTNEAWQAVYDSGVYSKEEFDILRGLVDVIKQVDAGKPVFNSFTCQYLGFSQQVVEAALGERLKGRQVPVTLRHFAPFAIELTISKVDENGSPLRNPRSHVTVHAMDINVLNRRKMNMWQRGDVKSLFKDFGHFSETFVNWFEQQSLDPSQRKPSAEFLRPEFGSNAERVRDIMYETWGGRKRNDESYINAPEGYSGGRDGPNYPIHSLRFDLMANVLKQSQIFPEAFRGQLGALRFNKGLAYEPMRRNAMIGSFVKRELQNGRSFYTDGNGYEIRGEEPSFKLFNPFGNLLGVFKSVAKAQQAAEKNVKKLDMAEIAPKSDDYGDGIIQESLSDQQVKPSSVYSGSANLMTSIGGDGRPKFFPLTIEHKSKEVSDFSFDIQNHINDVRFHGKSQGPNDVPVVKLSKLIKNSEEFREAIGPLFDALEATYDPRAEFSGGVLAGLRAGPQGNRQIGLADYSLSSAGSVTSAATLIGIYLQGLIDFKNKRADAIRTAFAEMDGDMLASYRVGVLLGQHYAEFNADTSYPNKDAASFDAWVNERQEKAYSDMALGFSINPAVKVRPSRVPSWVSGTIETPNGEMPRYASKLFGYFSGFKPLDPAGNPIDLLALMPQQVQSALNNWAIGITESFLKGESRILSLGMMFTAQINAAKWALPDIVSKFFDQYDQKTLPTVHSNGIPHKVGIFWHVYQKYKTSQWASHAFTKVGDRQTLSNFGRAGNEAFIRENVASSMDTEGAYADVYSPTSPSYPIEFGAKDANTDVQVARFLSSTDKGKSIILTGISDLNGTKFVAINEGLTLMGSYTDKGDALNMTTEPSTGLTNPMHSLFGERGKVEMPTDLETTILGVVPFSGLRGTGTTFKAYDSGWHVGHVADIANALKIPFDPAKQGSAQGLQDFVRSLYEGGINNADLVYLHGVATGAMMAEMAKSILAGDPNNYYGRTRNTFMRIDKNGNPVVTANWANTTPADYAKALANRGYAKIIHTVSNASLDSLSTAKNVANNSTRRRLGNASSIIGASLNITGEAKGHHKFTKRVAEAVKSLHEQYRQMGYDVNKPSPYRIKSGKSGSANLMLAGMSAKEIDMVASGALRFVKTDSGKYYKAFEFSDKEARLLTEKVGGKLHLIPFSKGGQADFDAYYKDFMRSQAPMMSTDSLKLGELLDHRLLYLHYPSLKDVRVEWDYGYGAYYNPDADVITLGIDRFIGKEMHERGSPDHLDYASFGIDFERNAVETILHEVQHAIQRREQWTDSVSVKDSKLFQNAGLILLNNITGEAGRTLSTERVVNDSGRVFFTDDPSSSPTQFQNAQIIQSIIKMAGSPMHMHLRQYAYPNLIRVAEESMLGLADAHMHHPAGHMSRVNAERLSKRIADIRNKAKEAMESFRRGEIREAHAKDIVCEHVMELENLLESGIGMLSVENSPLAYRLYNGMNNSLKYMRRSMQALNAFQIISKMADSGPHGLDVGSFAAKAKEIFSTVSTMQYLSQKHEIEANLTESRSRMTQEELNSTGINPDMTRVNGLDAIKGAMEIGYAGNSIKAIGLALKNKTPIRVANLMIAGTGDSRLKPEERSNDPLKLMARGALVSWVLRTLDNELQRLNAVAFYGRGWEIGKDGVPRLAFRQGIIRVRGNKAQSLDRTRNLLHGEFDNASVQGHGDGSLGIYNAIAKDGQTTVTLEDIARIIDGIVVSESELITPTEAMDIITRDDFPSVVKAKDLPEILKSRGISEDGLLLSNAALFSQVDLTDFPETLTKGELVDLISIAHRQLVHERTATRSMGVGALMKAKFDVENATPQKLISSVDAAFKGNSYYSTNDPVRNFIDTLVGRDAMPPQFDTIFQSMNSSVGSYGKNRFGLLNFDFTTGRAVFIPRKPDWVEDAVWAKLTDKWANKGYLDAGYFGVKQGLADTDAERLMRAAIEQQAELLNRRIARKMFLIKPFYQKIIEKLSSGTEGMDPTQADQLMAVKFSLLDEASLAMLEPDLAGFRTHSVNGVGTQSHRSFGSSMSIYESHTDPRNMEASRTYNQIGIAPAIYASGYSPEVRDAFVELQTLMPMVGFTSESTIRAGSITNTDFKIGQREFSFYGLIDDIGERRFHSDSNIQDNLMSVTSSAYATRSLAEKVLNELSDQEAEVSGLDKMRLLIKISSQAATLAQSATLLIGDVQNSSRDYVHRNVQKIGDGGSVSTGFIQELALLRGYRGADGGLVLQENLVADTSSALTHKRNMELPIWNNRLVPSGVGNRSYNIPVVKASVLKDLAARSIIFGAINDGNGNVTRPMSYIGPLSDLAATIVQTQQGGTFSERGVLIDSARPYTNGIHALHSALYLTSWEKGIGVTQSLTADSNFYQLWAQPSQSNTFNSQHDGGHTIESYAIGIAPFLAVAMSEKVPVVKNGKLVVGDILSVEQRALLKAARDAYRGHDFSVKFTPEMDAARKAFFETLDSKQISAIISHLTSSNSNYGILTMLGVMNAYQHIKRLPEAPNLSQKIGNETRAELNRQLDFYLTEGRYATEMGVNERDYINSIYNSGVSPHWIGKMASAVFSDPITQNALLAAWSVMDSSARAYVPDMTDGNPSKDRPHSSLMTYMSPLAYKSQSPTFSASNTAVGSHFTGHINHPNRSHSIVAADTNVVQQREFQIPAIGFSGEQMGLAEALFKVYDPASNDPNVFVVEGDEAQPNQSPDSLLGVHKADVGFRGSEISQTFIRKNVVNSIIAQAKKMGTDKVSIEPARFRLSGRAITSRSMKTHETESGGSGIKYKAHAQGVSALFAGLPFVPDRDNGTTHYDNFAENMPFMTNPMAGFAWKRLEDGRLVINITGDHAGYKAGYLGRQYTPQEERRKIPIGFSIQESLGYDPYTGDISPANIHMALFGNMNMSNYAAEPSGMNQAFSIGGASWRKQLIKSARARIAKGDSIRTRYEGIDANKSGIPYRYSTQSAGFEKMMSSDDAHNDADAVALAYSILGHRTGHQYASITLPADATPEVIRSVLNNIFIGGSMSNLMRVLASQTQSTGMLIPPLGDGASIYGGMKASSGSLGPEYHRGGGKSTRLEALMRDSAGSSPLDSADIEEILKKNPEATSEYGQVLSVEDHKTAFSRRAALVLGRNPRLLGDIEKVAELAIQSDHGFSIPDAERHITKNGDTTLAIELMFPNRQDLLKFAWDGKEENGVSIVHRGPKAKPTGYFVTYDFQTGIDQYGNPITTKKVVPVKTLAEAESIRAQFGVKASKAIMAQALVAAGMDAPQIKQGVTNPDSNVDFSVQTGKFLRENESGLAMVNSKSYYVGDFDKSMTPTEANAVSQALSTGSVLQTQLPPVQVRSANLMIGSRDARELEGLLRRKLTFGNGSGPVEFSSKLMKVVAYGKRKSGRDLYPDSMTGAEWYKFIRENAVSKDEIRMTGIVYLLHDNMNTPLTRQDLAEFIYTVYPRTSRQIRRANNNPILSENRNIKAGSLSGLYNLPFIDDVQAKEDFVVNTHLDNLQKVAKLIEDKLHVEETHADAQALAAALQKSLEFTIAEMGMPPDLITGSLMDSIEAMRSLYRNTTETSATKEGFFGETRGVRPAQLEYVMRDVIWGRLGDQYKTIETFLGELGFINPYEIEYSNQTRETNPLNPTSGEDAPSSLNVGIGVFKSVGSTYPYPSASQQNLYFHGGNYHASYATFTGFYQSSPQFVEVTNVRLLEESRRAKETLKDRMNHAQSPEQKKKIQSIIDTIERVEAVRKLVGGQVADFSHYDNNDPGTFQLGHVRSTETVLSGEYGIANHTEPAFHGEDAVSGFKYAPEAVIGIEEIQSDSFQYHTFGDPNTAEKSLPDTFEQIEGLKKSGDLAKLIEAKKRLEASVKDAQTLINQNLKFQMMNARGDNRMNTMFLMKNLSVLSPIELYMLKDSLTLKETGRTMQVPAHYRPYIGKETIPVYAHPDLQDYRTGRIHENEEAGRMAVQVGRRLAVQINNLAHGDLMAALLPKSFMGYVFENDSFSYREDSSNRPQPTPSFVFMIYAAQDPEVISKSLHITESNNAMVGATDVDWDAVAARTIDRIEAMRESVLSSDAMEQDYLRDYAGPRASRLAKAKFFDNLIATYRERLESPRNQMLMPEVQPDGAPVEGSFGRGYEDSPLASSVTQNPNRYVLIESGQDHDRMNPAQLLFPSAGMISNPMNAHQLDFRNAQRAPAPDADTASYAVQYVAANTALGQFAASSISGLISHVSRMGVVPAQIKDLQARIDELSPQVPIKPSTNAPRLTSTLPYGVEDIYKPVAVTGTVLRAANAGFGAITYSDARMQVMRGHSLDIVPTMLIGRQANMLTMASDNTFAHIMAQIFVLPESVRSQLHGGLFKRLAEVDNAFFVSVFRSGNAFEHNGVSGDIRLHVTKAAIEAAPLIMTDGIMPADMGDVSSYWRAVAGGEAHIEGAMEYIGRPADPYVSYGESSMLDADGKPYRAKDLPTDFFQRNYGRVSDGEKNDRQRVIDSAVANAGSSMFYWSEAGRAMGYVSQYGAPSWFIQSIMYGQKQASIDGFSTDAFQRPLVTVAADGTYTLVDPKTGRAIMEKINNPTMLREAFFQNSKYMGRLPYISKFLSEWSPVGAYVTQGHTHGKTTGESMVSALNEDYNPSEYNRKGNILPASFGGVVSNLGGEEPKSGSSFRSQNAKPMAPFGPVFSVVGPKVWMKHVNKVNVSDPEALSRAMSTYFSCGGPVLRFKPRMPTEAHKKAFRKKIVDGIAMLMPSGGGRGRAEPNTQTLEMLSRMYRNFSKVTMGRKIPTKGEALEDEDDSAR
jgi:hypothetical protein